MRLGDDVKVLVEAVGHHGELVGAHAGQDAAALAHGLGADKDAVDTAELHGVGGGGDVDGGDGDTGLPQGEDGRLAVVGPVHDVDDAEVRTAVELGPALGRAEEHLLDAARAAARHDGAPRLDVAGADVGDSDAGGLGLGGEVAAVAEEVLAHLVEAEGRVAGDAHVGAGPVGLGLLPKGLEEGLHEEVGAGARGDGVGHGGLEMVDLRLEDLDGLEDGGRFDLAQELDQGLDGRYRHGEFLVLGEYTVVGCDEAERGEEEAFMISQEVYTSAGEDKRRELSDSSCTRVYGRWCTVMRLGGLTRRWTHPWS